MPQVAWRLTAYLQPTDDPSSPEEQPEPTLAFSCDERFATRAEAEAYRARLRTQYPGITFELEFEGPHAGEMWTCDPSYWVEVVEVEADRVLVWHLETEREEHVALADFLASYQLANLRTEAS